MHQNVDGPTKKFLFFYYLAINTVKYALEQPKVHVVNVRQILMDSHTSKVVQLVNNIVLRDIILSSLGTVQHA